MQETRVQSLGWEDPLEKEMATHSSTLAWRLPWREEPDRLQSMGSQRVRHNWVTSLHFTSLHFRVKSGCGQRRTAHAAGPEEKRQVSCAKHLKFGYPSGNLSFFLVRHSAQVFSEGANRACCFLETFVFMLPGKNLNPVKWQRTTYCYLHLSSNSQPTIALKSNRPFQLQRDWASNQHFQWSFKISFYPSCQKQNFFTGIGMWAALLLHPHPPTSF